MSASLFVPLVGIALMIVGLGGVAAAAWRSHKTTSRLDFIRSLGSEAELYADAAPTVERVQEPLINRMFGPAARGFRNTLTRLYPSSEVDRVHADLLKAGLTGTLRAEEFVAIQMGSVLLGVALGLACLVSGALGTKVGVAMLFILPIVGGLAPTRWLRSRIKTRRMRVHQRSSRPARPDDDLSGGRSRLGAGDAGLVCRASNLLSATSCD